MAEGIVYQRTENEVREQGSKSLCGHSPTFLRTLFTHAGAFLAVVVIVFAAFVSTSLAGVSTDSADFFCSFASKTH